MEKSQEQLTTPLAYQYNDPEKANPVAPPNDPPRPFTEPAPTAGQEFVPPVGTVAQPQVLNALSRALIRKINEAGANYEGPLDQDGHRHGSGRITYIDGTTYVGEFAGGKRQGLGEQKYKDGTLYKGLWQND